MTAEVCGRTCIAHVSEEPLDVAAHIAAVAHLGAGAVDVFIGTVRNHDPAAAGEVVALDYESHPSAAQVLSRLASMVARRFDGVRIAVSHRTGSLRVGDAAVVIATSAPHRAEALDATRGLIELVKTDLPIWKRQTDENGTSAWIGLA